MSLYNYTDVIKEVKIGTSGYSEVYVGDTKVFPPPVVGNKLTVINTTGHSGYSIDCNASSTLTQEECRLYDMDYRTFTDASIGTCVESIGPGAFGLYYALSAITIPSSVISIGQTAFHICSGLTSVVIPDSVTSIGQGCFEYCFSLASVAISSAITTIPDYAFVSCSSLTSVVIPSGVTSIGNSAFQGCSGLTEIRMQSTTPPTLAGSVFDDTNNCPIKVPCGSLAAYQQAWPSYASRLVEDCDYGYKAKAIYNNDPAQVYDVPCTGASDTTLNTSDFNASPYPNSAMTHVNVYCETIGAGCFSSFGSLRGFSCGSGVKSIQPFAFSGCSALTQYDFGDSVEVIDRQAFQNANIPYTLYFPASIQSIGYSAFETLPVSYLHTIRMLGTVPPTLGYGCFGMGVSQTVAEIYVPHGCLQDYENGTGWSYYASLLQEMPE